VVWNGEGVKKYTCMALEVDNLDGGVVYSNLLNNIKQANGAEC
jgi:hypothetical protein